MPRPKGFFALSLAATGVALFVIVLGAYTRLSDAGLGCPDWPGCYGRLVVPETAGAIDQANAAYPQRPVEAAKAWKEMIHRYAASSLGMLILVLAAIAVTRRRQPDQPLALPLLLAVLVIFQGLLGMWTVTLLLKPLIVTLHLLGGMATLSLLWWLTLRGTWRTEAIARRPALKTLTVTALVVTIVQIALGGWTSSNYAAVACIGFPACNGLWWPQMDFGEGFVLWRGLGVNYEFGVLDSPARTAIHMAHRLGALLTFAMIAMLALRCLASGVATYARAGAVLATVLLVQIALGVGNVVLGLPLAVATAHNGVAGVLLLTVVTLLHLQTRVRLARG
jgi:cytochrome c oxidase assembly protein subunit 15